MPFDDDVSFYKRSYRETQILKSPAGDFRSDYTRKNGLERKTTKYESPRRVSVGVDYMHRQRDKYAGNGFKYKTESEIKIKQPLKMDYTSSTYKQRDKFERNGFKFETESEINCKQPSNFNPFIPTPIEYMNSAGVNSSGCILYKDHNKYKGIETKIDGKSNLKIEEDIDGAKAKIELESSFDLGISEQKARIRGSTSIQDGDVTLFQTNAEMEANNEKVNAKIDTTLFRVSDKDGDIKFLSGSAEAEIGATSDMVRVGLNVVDCNIGKFKTKVGINLDTGYSINNNVVEAKFEGFGFKVGKEMGISTPFGEVSYKFN